MLTARQKQYLKNLTQEAAARPVAIFPWEERGLTIAQSVIDDIYSVEPKLQVHFMGSVSLRIAGQRDIDLTSADAPESFQSHQLKLQAVLGNPDKINPDSIVWHFARDGYEVSYYIIDPNNSDQLSRQVKIDIILRNNKSLLEEYEQLKLSLQGKPYRLYQEKKFEFLNEILRIWQINLSNISKKLASTG